MNSKVTSQEVLHGVAVRSGLDKGQVKLFAKALQEVITEGLLSEGLIKINGLGVFKLVWTEPRKSINVQTGESIELPAHSKLVFTPETSVKELVNAPLSHLEPVVLGEPIEPLSSPFSDDVGPLERLSQQASELQSIISDINDSGSVEENVSASASGSYTDDTLKQEPLDSEAVSPINQDRSDDSVATLNVDSEKEINCTEQADKVPSIDVNEAENTDAPVVKMVNPFLGEQVKIKDNPIDTKKQKVHSRHVLRWCLIFLGVLILVGVTLGVYSYFYVFDHQLPHWLIKEKVVSDVPKIVEIQAPIKPAVILAPDTVEANVYHRERRYDSFLDTINLTPGGRLTLLALKYYGLRDYWIYIYEANKEVIRDPNKIDAGTKLLIPRLDPVLVDPKNSISIAYARELQKNYFH